MRIACISNYLPVGSKIGAGYQMHYLANAYVRRGHDVTMFSPFQDTSPDALYENICVPVENCCRTFRFAWNLRKIDFTSFNLLHAGMDDYALLGCPRPFHIRTFMGSCLAEALVIPGAKEKLRMLLLGLSELLACAVADTTVAISENTRHAIPFACHVIGCGVDTSVFYPAPPSNNISVREARPTILFVGTYQRRKRGKLLMEAFQREVRSAIPDAQLWMVCEDGPPAPGVTHYVRIPTLQLADLYRRAWVFCLPSQYEGFGVPYLEAMASGTPVVATPNPGAREVLENGRLGVLTKPEQLGHTLTEVLQDATTRQTLAANGLAHAQQFSWEAIISRYERLFPAEATRNRRFKPRRPC